MTDTSNAGHFSTSKKLRDALFDMENDIYATANLATALSMAISGMDKINAEDEDQQRALQCLADEVHHTAHKLLAAWEAIELPKDTGNGVPAA